jgi:predicted branched-subunit amino acid permease
MYMFLLEFWIGWCFGKAIGGFLGRTIGTPLLIAAMLWLFSPLILAYVVYTSVRDYAKVRRARRRAYTHG